jgi:hypothetical protein
MDNEHNTYVFNFHEAEDDLAGFPKSRDIRYSAAIHRDDPWTVPLKQFVQFLSSIYGYNISDKIIVKSLLDDDFFETVSPNPELTKELKKSMEEEDSININDIGFFK